MPDLGIFDLRVLKNSKELCKGKIYRCRVNLYMSKNGSYNEQVKMIPMKRLSCPGCEYCQYTDESLSESVGCQLRPIIDNPADNKLYKMEFTNISRDYETGIVDDYDIEFIKQ